MSTPSAIVSPEQAAERAFIIYLIAQLDEPTEDTHLHLRHYRGQLEKYEVTIETLIDAVVTFTKEWNGVRLSGQNAERLRCIAQVIQGLARSPTENIVAQISLVLTNHIVVDDKFTFASLYFRVCHGQTRPALPTSIEELTGREAAEPR